MHYMTEPGTLRNGLHPTLTLPIYHSQDHTIDECEYNMLNRGTAPLLSGRSNHGTIASDTMSATINQLAFGTLSDLSTRNTFDETKMTIAQLLV